MKQILRPAGLIAFVATLMVIFIFWWLLADWLLKQSIEQGGSTILGSQVELQSAELTLSPLGFTLRGLQVTDPSKPMKNAIQAEYIHGDLSLLPLLMGQVIIDEMIADGVAFATPRAYPGIISQPVESSVESPEEDSSFSAPDLSLQTPDMDEILARLPIQTIKLAEQFDQESEQQLAALQQQLDALPDEQAMKDYEDRLKEAVEGKVRDPQDLQRRLKQLKQIKSELREEKQRLTTLREQIKTARNELSTQWKTLKKAPQNDVKLLRENYSPESRNLSNIAGLLFGSEVQSWVALIQPYLPYLERLMSKEGSESETATQPPPPRGEGRFIHFASENPRPDFLIKQARLSLNLTIGNVIMQLQNATHQPQILGRPMHFSMTADKLPSIANIDIRGVADYSIPNQGYSKIEGNIDNWQVKQFTLSSDNKYPISMNATQMISGKLNIDNNGLSGEVNNQLKDVDWLTGSDPSQLQRLLSQVNTFKMEIDLSGQIRSPAVNIRSDLDRRLGSAFKQQLKDKQAKLEQRFNERLNQEISQRTGQQSHQLQQLNLLDGNLSQQQTQIEEMLKAEVNNDLDEKKDELKNKLKDKLKGLF